MEIKKIDITKPLEAYDEVLDAVKRAGREPNTADRMLAMRAAIAAYEEENNVAKNASRYIWLRDEDKRTDGPFYSDGTLRDGPALDYEIDEAMKAQEKSNEGTSNG